MISYDLAKQIKDAGFPNSRMTAHLDAHSGEWSMQGQPTLSELIEACGMFFHCLYKGVMEKEWWEASGWTMPDGKHEKFIGKTAEEAVANFWLKLNKKS